VGSFMRIDERRIKQIIREELLREMSGDSEVDASFASLTNPNSDLSTRHARSAELVIERMREVVSRDKIRDGDLALEGITRYKRIKEIAGKEPGGRPYNPYSFLPHLHDYLWSAGLKNIGDNIYEVHRADPPPKPTAWIKENLANFRAAEDAFSMLGGAMWYDGPEWDEGGIASYTIDNAVKFARAMRNLDDNQRELDLLMTLRSGPETLTKFFKDPDFEDYHEQIIALIAGGLEDCLQAIELVSSLTM